MYRNNRKTIAFVVLGILLMGLLLLVLIKPSHRQTAPSDPEEGSSVVAVGLQNTEELNDILLPEQFSYANQALSSYIKDNFGNDVLSADIAPGSTVINGDKSISFTVKIEKPKKTFGVVLQRPSFDVLIFSVVGDSSSTRTLYPFGQ